MTPSARSSADTATATLCVLALLKRERCRSLMRTAFPRRRAHVLTLKSAAELDEQLAKQLVDAVVIDAGAGEEAARVVARADDYQSVPFVLMTSLLPADAPLVARAAEHGVSDEEGVTLGLKEKAAEFADAGGRVYLPVQEG